MSKAALDRRDFGRMVGCALAVEGLSGQVEAAVRPQGREPRPGGKKVRMGVVGGGMGARFLWHLHPNCTVTAVCDIRPERVEKLRKVYGCDNGYDDFGQFLKHEELDAVAIFTPPHLHVWMATQAMKAGKHAISAVPAGLSLGEMEQLLDCVKKTGLKYMMAETSRFRPEIITCVEWARQGKFGTIFYSESEYYHPGSVTYGYGVAPDCQTCGDGPVHTWSYGYPPMLYITHNTGMIVPVTGERLTEVVAVGWGDGHESLMTNLYQNPFWNSVAFFKTSGGHAARVTIVWHGATGQVERGSFYGDRLSYIMSRPEKSPNTVITQYEEPGKRFGIYQGNTQIEAFEQPDHWEKLPAELRVQTGHGGSHAFITHEFIDAIVNDRLPIVDAWEAVAYTVPGIIAHQSAIRGGEMLKIPDYGRAPGRTT